MASAFGTPVTNHGSAAFGPTSVSCTVATSTGDLVVVAGISSSSAATVPTDTIGNTYVQAGVRIQPPANSQNFYVYYCLSSIGTNAANSVKFNFGAAARGSIFVWKVPVTAGAIVSYDSAALITKVLSATTGLQTTGTFSTVGTDEISLGALGCDNPGSASFTAGSGYTLDQATFGEGQFDQMWAQHILFASPQSSITSTFTANSAATSYAYQLTSFKAVTGHDVSGNAGVAGALVSWTGTASGSTTADGSGNWTASNLLDGSYTFTPSLTGYSFSPSSQNETVSGSAITGVNFTATHLQVATTTFSPVAGTYAGAQTITLNNTNSGLGGFAMYYTTDGSTPTTGSTHYTTPFSLPDSATVKVLAVATGYIDSAIASAAYVITWSVSGSAGIAGATVAYAGPTSGTTTADGSGNYTFAAIDGSYTVTPTKASYVFTPTNQVVVVSGANQSGIDFTADLAIYSQPDCRVTKPNSATFEIVNGTKIYDVQTSSNPAIAPTDSRANKPVASGTYPQNSRNPNKYNN